MTVRVTLTNRQAVTEVVQPVSHDDHPGERGHASLLEVLLRVGVGVAVRVVVLRVVVVQDVVVVVVVVVHAVSLAHRVVEVRMTFVLAVLGRVGGGPRRSAVRLRRDDGYLRSQHHLLLLRHAAIGFHIWRERRRHSGTFLLLLMNRTAVRQRHAPRFNASTWQHKKTNHVVPENEPSAVLHLTFSGLQVVLLQSGLLLWIRLVVLVPLLLDLFRRQRHLRVRANSLNGFRLTVTMATPYVRASRDKTARKLLYFC